MLYRFAPIALAAGLLAGCATNPAPGTPAATAAAEQRRQEARVANVQASVEEAPAWFTAPPMDGNSLYAPGTATSADMQMAMDKATLSAKRGLADTLKGSLSSKMKEFISESGSGEDPVITSESERITSNLITETSLAGYSRTQSKLVPQGSVYRAYVLLQYPIGNANRILMDRVKQDKVMESKLRASKAFQDLEQEIQAARK
ncbi:hypothetical protein [Paramagnetospirillum caucaseum]|nr:hypothetical protein [Paramagnetospirillum caucaseum]